MSSTAASPPKVEVRGVHKAFGSKRVLNGLDLSVRPGESIVILGGSGTGKSVLLKHMIRLLTPDQGTVFVDGVDIEPLTDLEINQVRRKFGMAFQEGALFDSLSVSENVAYRLNEDRVDRDEIEGRVHEALRFVEMEESLDKMPAELSGGMRRRVSIARALVSRPPVVLYDSPTAGLDPVTAQTIITLIMRLRDTQGVTSLLATHRLQDAFGLANYRFDAGRERVMRAESAASRNGEPATTFLVLRDGGVYFEGGPGTVLESGDEYLKRFLV